MRKSRKFTLIMCAILALVCVLTLAAFATEETPTEPAYRIPVREGWTGPVGVTKGQTGWRDSGYSDIDSHTAGTNGATDVWVQVATNRSEYYKWTSDVSAPLTYGNGYDAYYNEYEGKVVLVARGNLHSTLYAHKSQASADSHIASGQKCEFYDVAFNMFALEFVFTQDAYKDLEVPGLGMTWSEYMSTVANSTDVLSMSFPGAIYGDKDWNDDAKLNSYMIIKTERLISDALYELYKNDTTYQVAYSEATGSDLIGSTFTPNTEKEHRDRALLVGLELYLKAIVEKAGLYETPEKLNAALEAFRAAVVKAATANTREFYLSKGSGYMVGWASGLENYFGKHGFVSFPFLVNTTDHENVGKLGATVEILEVRDIKGNGYSLQTFNPVLTAFNAVETVLFDSTMHILDPENAKESNRAFFVGMPALKTVAHVTFGTDGKFSEQVKTNVADLSGFDKFADTNAAYTINIFESCASIESAIWYKTLMFNKDTEDHSGVIPNAVFASSANFSSLTIPANANTPLTAINANAFKNSGIKNIYVLRSVGADFTVDSTAFTGCSDVKINVLTYADAEKAYAAISAAGLTKTVSVKIIAPLENPIKSDGMMVKVRDLETASADNTSIRFLFKWNHKATAEGKDGAAYTANTAAGYTFAGAGFMACSGSNYRTFAANVKTATGSEDESVIAMSLMASDSAWIIKDTVADAEVSAGGSGPFLSGFSLADGYYPFCISLFGIDGANVLNDIYTVAYTAWTDADGNTYYTFTSHQYQKDGVDRNTISLYDVTLGLLKSGEINTKFFDKDYDKDETIGDADKTKASEYAKRYLWDVIKQGALTTNEFTDHSATGTQAEYTLGGENKDTFTYWNVDYRKYVTVNSADFSSWGLKITGIESVPSSGLYWSIVQDGQKYVVLITKNTASAPKDVEYDYMVPGAGMSYTQHKHYVPFSHMYGEVNSGLADGSTLTVYSPAVTESVFNGIVAIVMDEGVKGINHGGLSGCKSVQTLVYPESCTVMQDHAIRNNTAMANVIWTKDPYARAEKQYNLGSLMDLRGFTYLNWQSLVANNTSAVNIVMGTTNVSGTQFVFDGATALERVWNTANGYDNYSKPESGIIDIDFAQFHFDKSFFNVGSKIHTVYVNSGSTIKSDPSSSQYRISLGNQKTIDYITNDKTVNTFVNSAITFTKALRDANYNYADKISVNGTSIVELISQSQS